MGNKVDTPSNYKLLENSKQTEEPVCIYDNYDDIKIESLLKLYFLKRI